MYNSSINKKATTALLDRLINSGLGDMPMSILTVEQFRDCLMSICEAVSVKNSVQQEEKPKHEYMKMKDLAIYFGVSYFTLRRHLPDGLKAGKIRTIEKPKMATLYNVKDVESFLLNHVEEN